MVYRINLRAEVRTEEPQIPVCAANIGNWTRCETVGDLCEYRPDKPRHNVKR